MVDEVIHEHNHHADHNNYMPFLFGFAILLVVIVLIFYFGRGFIERVPSTEINVPDTIDVNLNSQ